MILEEFAWLYHLETILKVFQHKLIVFPEMSTEPLKEENIAKLMLIARQKQKWCSNFQIRKKFSRAMIHNWSYHNMMPNSKGQKVIYLIRWIIWFYALRHKCNCTYTYIRVTSLEQLSLAEFCGEYSRPKVYENGQKKVLGIWLDLVLKVKYSEILIFKAIFLCRKSAETLQKK